MNMVNSDIKLDEKKNPTYNTTIKYYINITLTKLMAENSIMRIKKAHKGEKLFLPFSWSKETLCSTQK